MQAGSFQSESNEPSPANMSSLASSLHTYFGFPSFRPGQEEAIQSLLNGHHTLVVMPTGAGKSLIYQLATLLLGAGKNPPPLTLVISPLIALMKDQVDNLICRNIPATYINSALPTGEQTQRLNKLAAGAYRLVYIAPERLRSVPFLTALRSRTVSLLAIDEAHCISEWGHDFRPDYLHIAQWRNAIFPHPPLTVALTATATPQVQKDILRLLGLGDSATRIVTGFNRPNLSLDVLYTRGLPAKLGALNKLLSPRDANYKFTPQNGAVIVYTGTRRDAEEVAEFAQQVIKIPTEFYHAGLPAEERSRIQETFTSKKVNLVAATNAFGMGIDRADVRQVIHYSLPGSLEAYYQEAGRAGRDGSPAKATLLYDPHDRALHEFFIANNVVALDDLLAIHNAIRSGEQVWATLDDLSRVTGLHPVQIKVGLAELERAGALEHLGDEGLRMLFRKGSWIPREIEKAAANSIVHIKHRQKQLDRIVAYAESNSCRRIIILNYFGDAGEAEAADCCDNCRAGQSRPKRPSKSVKASSGNLAGMNHGERAALVILDCIRRVHIKVGRQKLAQILHGSKAKDILKFHSDKNVYYGRLAVIKQNDIEEMIGQLIGMGYIKVIGGKYPILSLTPRGKNAIQQKESIPLRPPRSLETSEVLKAKAKLEAGGTVESFLTRSYPRPLVGSWQTGWALGFHSRISGSDWSRSDVGNLTYRLKYNADTSVLPELIQQTLGLLQTHPDMNQADVIIPVPSSNERKVNPVHVFCEALAGKIKIPMQTLVVKTRQTQPQKEMKTLAQKRANVAGAFSVRTEIKGMRILLVDDLFDSGATLDEISQLLLEHGASRVNVLTLTRTIHSDA